MVRVDFGKGGSPGLHTPVGNRSYLLAPEKYLAHFPAVIIILAVTGFRALLMATNELHVDEAYYWEWSRQLAPAYYDQGPGVAFAIRFGTALFGQTEFGVRLSALLCGLGVSIIAYGLAWRLFQSTAAGLFTLAFFYLTPLNSLGSILMMHDSIMYLCWAGLIWAFLAFREARDAGRPAPWRWLYVAAVAMGVGLLSKHTMVLLAPPLLLFLLWYPRERRLFLNPHAWMGLLLACVLVLPLVVWNLAHDFAGVYAIVHLPTANPRGRVWHETLLEFLVSQVFVMSPVVFFLLLWVAIHAVLRRGERPELRFLAWTMLFMFGFFLVMSFRKSVSANWVVCGYFGATILLGGQAAEWWRGGKRWIPVFALGTSTVLVVLGLYPAAMIALTRSLGIQETSIDALPKLRLAGGREMAAALESVRAAHPGSQLGFNEYPAASLMAFYLPDKPQVNVFNVDARVNQYDFWASPNQHLGKDFVFLHFGDKGPSDGVKALFDEVELYPAAEIRRLGVKVWGYRIAVLKGFRGLPPQNRFQEAREMAQP